MTSEFHRKQFNDVYFIGILYLRVHILKDYAIYIHICCMTIISRRKIKKNDGKLIKKVKISELKVLQKYRYTLSLFSERKFCILENNHFTKNIF